MAMPNAILCFSHSSHSLLCFPIILKKNEDRDIDSHRDRAMIDITIPNAIHYKMR